MMMMEVPQVLQHIPDNGRNQLTNDDEFAKIETYLKRVRIGMTCYIICKEKINFSLVFLKDLESGIHPLGRLAAQVGDVYRLIELPMSV